MTTMLIINLQSLVLLLVVLPAAMLAARNVQIISVPQRVSGLPSQAAHVKVVQSGYRYVNPGKGYYNYGSSGGYIYYDQLPNYSGKDYGKDYDTGRDYGKGYDSGRDYGKGYDSGRDYGKGYDSGRDYGKGYDSGRDYGKGYDQLPNYGHGYGGYDHKDDYYGNENGCGDRHRPCGRRSNDDY